MYCRNHVIKGRNAPLDLTYLLIGYKDIKLRTTIVIPSNNATY